MQEVLQNSKQSKGQSPLRALFSGFLFFWGLIMANSEAFAVTSTEVLPKGVRALAIVFANARSVDSTFNNNGNLESLSRPLNRSVGMDDLEKAEPRLKTLRSILNSVDPQAQYGEKVLISNLFSDIEVNEKRWVYGLLWGITPSFSAGIIAPYINRTMTANFLVNSQDNSQAIKNIVGSGMPQVASALDEIHNMRFDTPFYAQKIFAENGYKTPASFQAAGWGDLELESRWKYYEGESLSLGLRGNVKLPTATHKADLSNLLDRDFGDNGYALRVTSVHTVKVLPGRLFWQSGLSGTYRFPTEQRMAVAKDSDALLPNLNDPNQIETVRKELGSQLDLDTGFNLDFWKGAVSLFSSYQLLWKEADKYSGKRGLDYARLSANTKTVAHAVESGVELSSVPLFLAQKAPLPAKLIATWNQPIKGKNQIAAPYGRLDAIFFF